MARKKIAIIGAGPIGLEAAAAALERGHTVRVFERGRIGESMREWGTTRLFSAFQLNRSALGAARLETNGITLPDAGDYLTANEHVARYLEPLARTFPSETVREQTRVVRIGKDRLLKSDLIGGARQAHPFRLLFEHAGAEQVEAAEIVLDCSGTWCQPNALGNGGIPAPGERAAAATVRYRLGEILSTERPRYAGKRVMLVGAGYSAATALDQLLQLAGTTIVWVRSSSCPQPFPRFPNDPLPQRDRLGALANRIAQDGAAGLSCVAGAVVERLEPLAGGTLVTLATRDGERQVEVDAILALVGFRPDRELYSELQFHECWATMGPIKLAASLLDSADADCLSQESKGVGLLTSPEPNFFVLGAKSYGTNSNFLIRLGFEQVHDVFTFIDDTSR